MSLIYDNKIAVLLPYVELLEFAQQASEKLGIAIQAEKINSTNAIQVANKVCENGAEVIVSRGNLAKKIRQNVNVDVVSVLFSEFEYLQAINKYRNTNLKIAVIENIGIIEGIKRLNQFYQMDIHYYQVKSVEEFSDKTIEAINEGNKVIIGGSWGIEIKNFLDDSNVKYEMIKSTKPSIESSIKNAVAIINSNRRKQNDIQILRNILTFAQNGIVIVNSQDKIVNVNPVAEKIFNIHSEKVLGQKCSVFLPMLNSAYTLQKKIPQSNINTIWKGRRYYIDKIPVFVGGRVESVIVFIKKDSNKLLISEAKDPKKEKTVSFHQLYGGDLGAKRIEQLASIVAKQSQLLQITGENGSGKKILAQQIHLETHSDLTNFLEVDCTFGEEILSSFFGGQQNIILNNNSLILPIKSGTIYLKNLEIAGEKTKKLVNILINRLVYCFAENSGLKIFLSSRSNCAKEKQQDLYENTIINTCNIINIDIPNFCTICHNQEDIIKNLLKENDLDYSKYQLVFHEIQNIVDGYSWPGNIFEFRKFVDIVVHMYDNGVDILDIKEIVRSNFGSTDAQKMNASHNLEGAEKQAIKEALKISSNNKTKAAQLLGVDRSTLMRKIKKYKID